MNLLEKMGDRPAWMKIRKYREEGRRSELVLGLNKRDYWFPLSPRVYETFQAKIKKSRLEGLTYLQDYIRRYRGYAGRWPSRRYVEQNKLSGKSFVESIAQAILTKFDEGVAPEDIAVATLIPKDLVIRLLQVSGKWEYDNGTSDS